nr:hypothetical protein [Tanacetum cinerariifolium]
KNSFHLPTTSSGHHPTHELMLWCMMDKSLLNRFRHELQDKVMLLQAKENGAVLDAKAEAFFADVECTVPLAEPLAFTTTNMFQALVNATLSAELDQCKLELARLERNKVKLECDQVIVARNKRNAELE